MVLIVVSAALRIAVPIYRQQVARQSSPLNRGGLDGSARE
jgi:hypothetical protein